MSEGDAFLSDDGTLLNAPLALIDRDRVIGYTLNPDHPVGRHKSYVFAQVLGYDQSTADELIERIREGIKVAPARFRYVDHDGARLTVDLRMRGPSGREAVVRTNWIYRPGHTIPQFTTAVVRRRRGRHGQTTTP